MKDELKSEAMHLAVILFTLVWVAIVIEIVHVANGIHF